MRRLWRTWQWWIIVAVVVIGFRFIPPVRDAVIRVLSPIIMPVRQGSEGTVGGFRLIASIPDLARTNGELMAKVNELEAQLIKTKELEHENTLLRQELQFNANQVNVLIAAQVISRSSSVTQQSLMINKGSSEGFITGMAVIAQGYFVGRVVEVLPHTSRVLLITSQQSLIPVVLQNSRSLGLLHGGTGGLVVKEIPANVAVEAGEAVATANSGDVVKNGIPVGKVKAVVSQKSDVFQSIQLESPVDLSQLEVVFGVK